MKTMISKYKWGANYLILFYFIIVGTLRFSPIFAQVKQFNQEVNYSINEAWKFSKENNSNSYKIDFPDANWTIVTIPHTWNNEDAMDETPGFYRGACWYRRSVFIGNEAKGKIAILNFAENEFSNTHGNSPGANPLYFPNNLRNLQILHVVHVLILL